MYIYIQYTPHLGEAGSGLSGVTGISGSLASDHSGSAVVKPGGGNVSTLPSVGEVLGGATGMHIFIFSSIGRVNCNSSRVHTPFPLGNSSCRIDGTR